MEFIASLVMKTNRIKVKGVNGNNILQVTEVYCHFYALVEVADIRDYIDEQIIWQSLNSENYTLFEKEYLTDTLMDRNMIVGILFYKHDF